MRYFFWILTRSRTYGYEVKSYDGHGICGNADLQDIKEIYFKAKQSIPDEQIAEVRINENTTVNIAEFIEHQKKKINLLYVETIGTESNERDVFIKIIEHLQHKQKER